MRPKAPAMTSRTDPDEGGQGGQDMASPADAGRAAGLRPQPQAASRSSIPDAITHIRNGRAELLPHVRGGGATWCGKKLVGRPEAADGVTETFHSYGNVLHVSLDPERGTCPHCRRVFEAAYAEAFPDGLKPIATFRADNADDLRRAKELLSPEALNGFFGPGGGGMAAFDAALRAQAIEARRAETGTGSACESAVGSADAPQGIRP